MPEATEPIIIIKRKKAGHAAHHGGAWKVRRLRHSHDVAFHRAVAHQQQRCGETVRRSVFQGSKGDGAPDWQLRPGSWTRVAAAQRGHGDLKKRLQAAATQLPNFRKLDKQIEISATPDGLEIELLEDNGGTFFELGSAEPRPALNEFLTLVSREVGKVPNLISVEGHTDSIQYNPAGQLHQLGALGGPCQRGAAHDAGKWDRSKPGG